MSSAFGVSIAVSVGVARTIRFGHRGAHRRPGTCCTQIRDWSWHPPMAPLQSDPGGPSGTCGRLCVMTTARVAGSRQNERELRA